MPETVRVFDVDRSSGDSVEHARDAVAVEAPLEVRLQGQPFSVIMRTPGADADLAVGFLLSEGVIDSPSAVSDVTASSDGRAIDLTLAIDGDRLAALLGGRRQVAMNSSCGVCGRRSLETLDVPFAKRAAGSPAVITASLIRELPARLRAAQSTFAATGGLHAAAAFTTDGQLEDVAEDVGRHNAVDKLLGRALMGGRLPLTGRVLFVSGRTSFEIVQKALVGGVPILAAVSAPSSLAVELAREADLTLLGFVRDGRFNIYAGASRVTGL